MGNEHILDRLGDGGLTFLMGMLVVFGGICIIVLSIVLVGKVIEKLNLDGTSKSKETETTAEITTQVAVEEEGIPAEIKVAIIAAVTSYYFTEQKSKCDFVVKKIRRL